MQPVTKSRRVVTRIPFSIRPFSLSCLLLFNEGIAIIGSDAFPRESHVDLDGSADSATIHRSTRALRMEFSRGSPRSAKFREGILGGWIPSGVQQFYLAIDISNLAFLAARAPFILRGRKYDVRPPSGFSERREIRVPLSGC